MAITKNIEIDGKQVPFRASAAIPRLYRIKFRRDLFRDMQQLKQEVDGSDEKNSDLNIDSLEMFENIAYMMAHHADPANVPPTPEEWLEQFEFFSIYQVLPELVNLWGMNTEQTVTSKKKQERLTGK